MNEKVDIEIFRRKLTVEMEGFTPMEISALAHLVTEKMGEISRQNEKIADTSKIATLAALLFAAELSRLKDAVDTETRVLDNKVEELTLALQNALHSAKTR